MITATWKGKIIAQSSRCEEVEGNFYFPLEDVREEFLKKSSTTTICPWKGVAHYYTIIVDDEENVDAAWYYPKPSEAAKHIKNYVAFWRGITVTQN